MMVKSLSMYDTVHSLLADYILRMSHMWGSCMVERVAGTWVVWREARGSRKSRGRLAAEELPKVPWEALWVSSSGEV